ncbi:unnamed protein product [Protopolystoma xenopodis]|uniref:FMP27/BLTP2/Hobbit GFWDK motif-containing RBG unit domain-containing protein n=1 Tax=Protopolystoma xenopodis TaxID=117903 RepID=A0A3S5B5K4_9PLAT|nr:unnamed protein product [Protopolystoma xenopodis]
MLGHYGGCDIIRQEAVPVVPGDPWPVFSLIRHTAPHKLFYDLNADLSDMVMCYGPNWEPTMAWLMQRMDDVRRPSMDPSQPCLGWWDRARLLLHGRLSFSAGRFDWLYFTTLEPYNATEIFAWQWTNVSVVWEPGHWQLIGNLDVFYRTASKYDGICRLLHLPRLELK